MEYNRNKPEKDFVKRTIEMAEEFKNHKYGTTAQINFLFGTIILPKSHWYNSLKQYSIKLNEIPGVSIVYKDYQQISLKVLLHCLRNGIAHWKENGNQNIDFVTVQNTKGEKEIKKVIIKGTGKVDKKVENVEVTFDVDQDGLVEFMKKIYDYLK
ncbi:HEPN family nuclease [Membranihabitans maritimus]|uniref:HEPN family nuclease n=1 Tax=Membranihabitans maritimus TaxID=2904244 RepID=UPI001F231356|nr:HEPN family nuclease [Membranihabitans maritimus]